jgi:hypothetical protein
MNRDLILRQRIKWLTWLFIAGLAVSGLTAVPLQSEVNWLVNQWVKTGGSSVTSGWLVRVRDALNDTAQRQPFLFYGTDWLAFGHLMIAVAFVGALRDPVRNRWLFDFGLIACVLVIPFALAMGSLRHVPFWWRMIDCMFGVGGSVPLWFCRKWSYELEQTIKHPA